MATSQNGWPALARTSSKLYTWRIPTPKGETRLTMRQGSAGFLLAHMALWFSEQVEPTKGKILDDWGYAPRKVRGSLLAVSNHASGTAFDVNATRHVLGKRGTFTPEQTAKIRARLKVYRGAIVWGGDFRRRADEMHFELGRDLAACERIARDLMDTDRGRRILAANPTQRAVILR